MSVTIDPQEASYFSTLATTWWEEEGPFKMLHRINPLRLQFILSHLITHFDRADHPVHAPLSGLSILDIGCGGGLLCEPLSRLGAEVTGIDAVEANLETARLHAQAQGLLINYQDMHIEHLVRTEQQYDVVIALEVLEHVAEPRIFLSLAQRLVKNDGAFILSTLNRTVQSYVLGIWAAENVLRWVPRGTHHWEKFIRPRELENWLHHEGFPYQYYQGLGFSPVKRTWSLCKDLGINYFVFASRHKKGIQHLDEGLSSWG